MPGNACTHISRVATDETLQDVGDGDFRFASRLKGLEAAAGRSIKAALPYPTV